MSDTTAAQIAQLETLRLPELQTRFAEVVGETTRYPNKRWLVARICSREALQESSVAVDEVAAGFRPRFFGTSASTRLAPLRQVGASCPGEASHAEGHRWLKLSGLRQAKTQKQRPPSFSAVTSSTL